MLHENRSFLECRDSQNNVTGVDNCLLGILEAAKVGSVIIALDAGERLFPTLLDHARRLGWDGECPKRKWKMGCKSVCMLEKKTGGFGGRKNGARVSGVQERALFAVVGVLGRNAHVNANDADTFCPA